MNLDGAIWLLDIVFPMKAYDFKRMNTPEEPTTYQVARVIATTMSLVKLESVLSEPSRVPFDDVLTILQTPSIEPPSVVNSYFNNPALSDLQIVLKDRVIPVHRVILCRGSGYFKKLLAGSFMESGAKTIELHDDAFEAMMAMFRFIYGLSYKGEEEDWHDEKLLVPHALVYVVAEKYQIQKLKDAVVDTILWILLKDTVKEDLVPALRILFAGTVSTDAEARPIMVKYCVGELSSLKKQKEFMTLLEDTAELGAAMLAHEDLRRGVWTCSSGCGGTAACAMCRWASRTFGYQKELKLACPKCDCMWKPKCNKCGAHVILASRE